jgi:hypothetical protein
VNDILSFDVGTGINVRTLFVKVVQNYSGPGGAQAGNGVGNGANPADSPLEVRTIGDLRNAINGLNKSGTALADQGFAATGIRATFDGATGGGAAPTAGRFTMTVGAAMKVNIDRNGAAANLANAIFGGAGATSPAINRSTFTVASTINNAAKEARLSAAASYRTALGSIRGFVDDAQVNGINLLRSTTGFNLQLSETVTTNFALRSTLGGPDGTGNPLTALGFTVDAQGNASEGLTGFSTNADVDTAITRLDNAINSLAGRDTELDVIKAVISERKSFNSDIITSLGDLSTDLTSVNQEEASAQAQAAQFSSNAALKSLGVSSQRANQLLQIF